MVNNISDVPIEQLYGHPVVQQLLSQLESIDLEKDVKLPFVIENKILMSPGVWNGYFYSSDSISQAFLNSKWDQKEIRSLFLDHEDLNAHEWIGEVKNARMEGDDVIGDLIIVDKPTAMKLAYGAKMGISPKVSGGEEDGKMLNFTFDNFSVVINPAVKTAYINNSQKNEEKEPHGKVPYADPGYQKDGVKRYPIDTEKHIRAAWSYINVPKNREFYTADQIKKIESKIKSAAKQFGIKIKNQEVNKMADEETKPEEAPVTEEPEKKEEVTEEPEAKEVEVENASDIVDAFSKLGINIATKAKELMEKNKDLKCIAAIEKAAKTLQEEDKEEEKPAEEQPAEEKKETKEMSNKEILRRAVEILNAEDAKPEDVPPKEEEKPEEKPAEEAPKEEPKEDEVEKEEEVKKEMSQMIDKQQKVIQTLSDKLDSVERKLNEPDKMSVKSEELSQEISRDPDAAFMSALKSI
jgi:hypothetical protein